MDNKDYYSILGVQRDADSKEIHRAYRRKARELHPDRNKGNTKAEDEFKKLGEAYRVLSDPKKRQQYDMFGSVGGDYVPPHGYGSGMDGFDFGDAGSFNPFGGDHAHSGFEDFFESIFNRFGSGHRGRRPDFKSENRRSTRGSDLEMELPLSIRDLYDERPRMITISVLHPCETCSGTGRASSGICSTCMGSGHVARKKKFKIKIPRGIEDGGAIRLSEQGNPSPHNSNRRGDLLIRVRIKPDNRFRIKGTDIETEVHIPDFQAALGGKIEVPAPTGKISLKLPAGSSSGKRLKVQGKGLPRRGGGNGDLLVTVFVSVPKKINERQRKLYEQLKDLN
jgi:DnaJ-class molecular chaperone